MSYECNAVAVIDDDDALRSAIVEALELDGLRALPFASGEAALAEIDTSFPGIVVSDLRMPGMDGAALFARIAAIDPDLPVIIITGHGDVPTAVDLMRRGAYDFISKPFSTDRLLPTVRRALEKRALVHENRALRQAASDGDGSGWLGASAEAAQFRLRLRQLADFDRPILLVGETGTGKTHAAGLLHRSSRRARQTMLTVDCGALPDDDPAAYLFGRVSGVSLPRTGALRHAHRGTLVLDHVDQLPASLFADLTRVLETRSVLPVGSDLPLPLDAAIIATAGPRFPEMVDAGQFDRALFHRLAGYQVSLAPLRTRRDDLPALFGSFVQDASERMGVPVPPLPVGVTARLRTHDWPGNAHELMSFADEVALGSAPSQTGAETRDTDLRGAVALFEAEYIRAALTEAGGDIETARARLGLPRKTLYDKLARHAIVAADFRRR